jgi:hypothetical protein
MIELRSIKRAFKVSVFLKGSKGTILAGKSD